MVRVKTTVSPRVEQGDVYRDVEYVRSVRENEGVIEVVSVLFPVVVVLTQDCDLEQDFRCRDAAAAGTDKTLISALVAPLYNVEHFKTGTHLQEVQPRLREQINWNGTEGRLLKNNERDRFHYLLFPPSAPIVQSVVDFKHYFSVAVEYLTEIKAEKWICRLQELDREDLCQRFASFLSRIAVPATGLGALESGIADAPAG